MSPALGCCSIYVYFGIENVFARNELTMEKRTFMFGIDGTSRRHRAGVGKVAIRATGLKLGMAMLSLAVTVWPLGAQTALATLNGEVFDPQHALIADAAVTITNVETGVQQRVQTSTEGSFKFDSLPPDTYTVHVERAGFTPVSAENVVLHTADDVAIKITMNVGSSNQTVTVNANALTNDSPAISLTVTHEFVENMPLNGRSVQDLIQLAPGAVSTGFGYYSINGQRMDSNSFTVDGVSANLGGLNNSADIRGVGPGLSGSTPAQTTSGTTQSLVPIDDLQEFTVQTSGYDAEYGRNPGGQLEFTTRSGTNQFHGSLFEYFRNTGLDSRSFFENFYQEAKAPERQNDFGGTVGGPVIIPKLYDGKDKTFFFFSYEGLRLMLPTQEDKYTPTQQMRDAASPQVAPFLNSLPLPNGPTNTVGCNLGTGSSGLIPCDGLFTLAFSQPYTIDSVSARIDHDFGERNRAFVRYSDTPSHGFEGTSEEEAFDHTAHVRTWTAGLTSNINATLLNDLRFNYSYDGEGNVTVQQAVNGSVPFDPTLLIPSQYYNLSASGEFVFRVSGSRLIGEPSIGGATTTVQPLQIVDGVSWTKGMHSAKFGVDWRRVSSTYGSGTYDVLIESESLTDIENGIASFANVSALTPGRPAFINLSLYAADHWKLAPRLTLDYGLRWEFNPPPGPLNGMYPVALTSTDIDTASLKGLGSSPYPTSYRHFAPRVGVAWNAVPSAAHPVTVRGGFGIFYDTGQQIVGAGYGYHFAYPFEATGPQLTEVPLPLTAEQAAPPPPVTSLFPVPDFSIFDVTAPNLTLPYTEQWNLSVDYALSAKNTFTASYIGNNGKKLLFTEEFYPIDNPNLGLDPTIDLNSNAAKSTYHALQLQDRGRIIEGLDVVTSFTWAHAEDNSSTDYDIFSQPIWGNSDYDIRRSLDVALNYKIPAVGDSRWKRALTGGWLIANRLSVESALPINVIQTQDDSGEEEINYYPDLVKGVPIYLHGYAADNAYAAEGYPNMPYGGTNAPGEWALNPAAFAQVPLDPTTGLPVRQGDLGRNFVRQLPFWALNTSVQRTFPLGDRLHLDFRLDAFNILNHANQTDPDADLQDGPYFGFLFGETNTIGSGNPLYAMGAPRSLQLSLKVSF